MEPISIVIDNFFSHSFSEVDFTGGDSTLIMGMNRSNPDISNGTGKSSIFEAITYALFNKTRKKNADSIVKYGNEECSVSFEYKFGNNIYKIDRKRNRRTSDAEVVYYVLKDGAWDNISGTTSTETNRRISNDLKMSYDVFLNSVFFRQNDVAVFANSTTSKKKELLLSLLKIDMWEEYKKKANDALSRVRAVYELNEKSLEALQGVEKMLFDAEFELSGFGNKRRGLSVKLDNFIKKLNTINETIANVSEESLEISNNQLKEVKSEIRKSTTQLNNDNTSLEDKKSKLEELRETFDDLTESINKNKQIIKNTDFSNIQKYERLLEKGKKSTNKYQAFIESYNNTDNHLDDCFFCGSKVDNRKFPSVKNHNLEHYKSKIKDNKDKIVKLNALLKEQNQNKRIADRAVQENETSSALLKVTKDSIENFNSDISDITNRIRRTKGHLKDLNDKLVDVETIISEKQSFDVKELHEDVADTNKSIRSIKQSVSDLDIRKGQLNTLIEQYKNDIATKNKLLKEQKVVGEELSIYSNLVRVFGKDGVPAIIMENIVDELEQHTNNILEKLCSEPTTISIDTVRQTTTGSYAETFDFNVMIGSRSEDFSGLSGSEQFRIAFAFRVALSKVLSNRTGSDIKFLLIDEVDSSLDKAGIGMFIDVIKILEDEFKILVITHNDDLKEHFQNVIVVEKGPQGATVTQ